MPVNYILSTVILIVAISCVCAIFYVIGYTNGFNKCNSIHDEIFGIMSSKKLNDK